MTGRVLRMQFRPRHTLRGRLVLPNVLTERRTSSTPPIEVYSAMRGPAGNGAPPPVSFGFGSVSLSTLMTMPVTGVITELLLDVEDAFDGIGATLLIGIATLPERLMPSHYNDLSVARTYSASPMALITAGTPILATYTAGAGATRGAARLYFVINPAPQSSNNIES